MAFVRPADGAEAGGTAEGPTGERTDASSRDGEAEPALHDPLTGLPGRVLFTDRLSVALARSDRRTSSVAVLLLDLDRFRLANEDVVGWLVSNGWALAAPDGPYVSQEESARAAKKGIFGAPPDTSAVPEIPDAPATSADIQPVMTDEGVDPQPSADPRMAFPPAPQP
jgi:hypothetical protein